MPSWFSTPQMRPRKTPQRVSLANYMAKVKSQANMGMQWETQKTLMNARKRLTPTNFQKLSRYSRAVRRSPTTTVRRRKPARTTRSLLW